MSTKIRWGVLSTAKIGRKQVIPGMQHCQFAEVTAIASRSLETAQATAKELAIPKAYGSYEELLADPDIDAIYNPLPNDLHVPWTIKAAEAGKHVLCEKPIALNADEARSLLAVRARTGVKIGEAFMVKLHPQWIRTSELIAEGRIGPVRLVTGTFSYFNDDATNIRNKPEMGGGALMDIGCYLIFAARQFFAAEPNRVVATIDRDPTTKIDRLTSFLLEFPAGHAICSCSTQLVPNQRIQAIGTKGRIELELPVNSTPEHHNQIFIDDGGDRFGRDITPETFDAVDQYTLQGDAFSRAILDNTEVPVPIESAVANMAIIDALIRSTQSNTWEKP